MRILVVLALVLCTSVGPPRAAQGAAIATVTVDVSHPGAPIPATFMGLSHEWSTAQQLMGSPSTATGLNPIYRQLVQNLLAYGAGPIIIRIGGNSTDLTSEGRPDTVDAFAQLYTDIGAQFILGVNLGANDVGLATRQARTYIAGMPPGSLQAIEIGNEPDLFHSNGDRPSSYAYADYATNFDTWRTAIAPLLPAGVGLVGPSWSSASSLKDLPTFLDAEGNSLSAVSQHWYAGTQCNGRTNPSDFLLRPQSAISGPDSVGQSVQLAHQHGLPFRVGEMNSISCGGEPGVSDIFASALWAADAMFELANEGVDGVNIHTGNGGGYALFTFNKTTASYTLTSVRPEYYGLLLFQAAAPADSQLLPVNVASSSNVKAWASVDPAGVLRITLINKDESAGGNVTVQVPTSGSAALTRLLAPGLSAQSGITLGGQSFDGSADGTLQGAAAFETVAPTPSGYTVAVPPLSAALLTISDS